MCRMRRSSRLCNPPQSGSPKNSIMLKITVHIDDGVVVFELEGKLSGLWVNELERSWRAVTSTKKIYSARVDLSSVTFMDQDGRDLLRKMYVAGAKLVTTGCLNKCIVEGIMQTGG
jgi:anti-anti-sigma regulatory factor